MKEDPTINYAFALEHYNQNGRGRSMKKFCEEEGYDYEKFMQYSRRGQKDYSVLKEADDRQSSGGFPAGRRQNAGRRPRHPRRACAVHEWYGSVAVRGRHQRAVRHGQEDAWIVVPW